MKREFDSEFALASQVFNLAPEVAEDPERVLREKREAEERAREAAAFQRRCQLQFNNCPGLVGADPPAGPGLPGRVVIDPRQAPDAMAWLKRRYRVSQNLELSGDTLVVDVIARAAANQQGRRRVSFDKPQQFTLDLGV